MTHPMMTHPARWRPRITHARPAVEMTTAPPFDLTTFPDDEEYDELVVVQNIPLFHARRPQTQERLTKRIADHLGELLEPRGVGIVVEAEHTCMTLRGARAAGSRTVTSALFGRLRDDARSRAEFLSLAGRHA